MKSAHGGHNLLRPVESRANLMAASFDSVPELQKKTRSRPGTRLPILSIRAARWSL
jgi:hypothetical protein